MDDHISKTNQNKVNSQVTKAPVQTIQEYWKSTPHIGLEGNYGMDSKGNCIIAEKFSDILKQDSTYLSKIKAITVAHTNMSNGTLFNFADVIQHQVFNLDFFCFSNNRIGDDGILRLLHGVINAPQFRNVVKIDFSNNKNISDEGARYLSEALGVATLPATKVLNLADNNITDTGAAHLAVSLKSEGNKLKVLHLEGNKITKTGEGYLVKALLDKAVQHMVIFTQKLEQNSKLFPFVGSKEEKTAIYKEYLKKGIEKGTNDKCIVVDKTLWGEIVNTKNQGLAVKTGVFGFIKCNWKPEDVIEIYAQEKLTAKISKTLTKIWGKITNAEGIVSCYLEATDEMYTSVPGQKALAHEVYVAGESDICSE